MCWTLLYKLRHVPHPALEQGLAPSNPHYYSFTYDKSYHTNTETSTPYALIRISLSKSIHYCISILSIMPFGHNFIGICSDNKDASFCQIGKKHTVLFPLSQCVFPFAVVEYMCSTRIIQSISRQGTIPTFESKLSHQILTRNRFTETPLIKPGAGTNLEACIFSMPNPIRLAPI